jgi:formylmethanofuran dehydrogenase subunit C
MANPLDDELGRIVEEEFKKRNPERAEHHFSLGGKAFQSRDFSGATQHYQMAFNNDPRPDYLRNKGNALLYWGKLKEGLEAHTEAITLEHKGMSSQDVQRVLRERVHNIPIIRLDNFYSERKGTLNIHPEEDLNSWMSVLEKIPYSLEEAEGFFDVYKSDSLEFTIFMCAVGNALKPRMHHQTTETELHPYVESEFLMPQLLYLAEHAQNAKVGFQGLDAVVLTECSWASLSEFRTGKLVVDCELPGVYPSVGTYNKGGQMVLTQKVKPESIGHGMRGGTITYEGDLEKCDRVGQEMSGGTIIINGNVKGAVSVGDRMSGTGNIVIKKNYYGESRPGYIGGQVGGGLDSYMRGGNITIEGDYMGNGGLGAFLKGGTINVYGNVRGNITIGMQCKSGASIVLHKDCLIDGNGSIGNGLDGGSISVLRDCGGQIGSHMESGEINISGDVVQNDPKTLYPVGSFMKGGKIRIGRNVDDISADLYGGEIRIGGTFTGKDYWVRDFGEGTDYNGRVYERGQLITPLSGMRLAGKIVREFFK